MSGTSEAHGCAAAVASLPAMTPQRLRRLGIWAGRERHMPQGWVSVWEALASPPRGSGELARVALEGETSAGSGSSEVSTLATLWARAAAAIDPPAVAELYLRAGATVALPGDDAYPAALVDDPEAPAVLFVRGRGSGMLGSLRCPVAAVVGTRSSTGYGRDVAAWLGVELARAGVTVVSGLATGVDAAVHEGCVVALCDGPGERAGGTGPPPAMAVAVVAAGLDVEYPRQTVRLRRRIEERGAVISEAPLGAPALPWRFPLRNRLIAGMAQAVVVVESHRAGGSLSTVEAALARGISVLAVPGSVRSPASEGTNALLASGAQVCTGPEDVLVALSLAVPEGTGRTRLPPTLARRLDPFDLAVLSLVEREPTSIQSILARTGRAGSDLGAVAMALERLAEVGAVGRSAGGWERL